LMVQVVRDDGQPFASVRVRATTAVGWVSWASGSPVGVGAWSGTAVTSAGGFASFALPDVAALPASLSDTVTFTIEAQDVDGNGFPDFDGLTATRSARSLPAGVVLLSLGSIDTALTVVSSNVPGLVSTGVATDSVPSVLDAIDAVRIVFNQPVDPALLLVTVSDEDGNPLTVTTGAPVGAGNLVLTQPPAEWAPGAELNVVVHAVTSGSNPPRVYDGWGAFFTLPTAPAPTVSANRDPLDNNLVHLTFSEPVGVAVGAGWSLGGASCPVFVGADLNGDLDTDDQNESGGADCTVTMVGNEVDPSGPAGLSGFTTEAYFYGPSGLPGPGPLVTLDLRFSRAATAGTVLRTATGVVVPDMPLVSLP